MFKWANKVFEVECASCQDASQASAFPNIEKKFINCMSI